MKRLCCDRDPESCEELRAKLAENGIACVIKDARDTPLFDAVGGSAPPALPELWVVEDDQFEAAWSILNDPQGSPNGADPQAEDPTP
jgi:hypothetical protein